MSSATNENTKLIVTAVGAALAGAAAALAISKYSESNNTPSPSDNNDPRGQMRDNRTSYIFEDPASSTSSSVIFPHNHEEKMRRLIAARAAIEEDNSMPRRSVTVRVPATSANMGPGCKYQIHRQDSFCSFASKSGAKSHFVLDLSTQLSQKTQTMKKYYK